MLIAATAVAAACDNPAGSRLEPGLHVVSGAGVTDTVDALPLHPLVVQLIGDDGKPRIGVPVRFRSVVVDGEWARMGSVLVSAPEEVVFAGFATDTTDAEGRAYARVRLGAVPGPGGVVATASTVGLEVTARYTIRPGQAARVDIAPSDTMVFIGGHFTPRVVVGDRHGNPRPEAAVLRVASGPVTGAGSTVTGAAFGRAMLVAELDGMTDTTWVSVMPHGSLAAYTRRIYTSDEMAIYMVDLDGSDLRRLATTVATTGIVGGMPPAWNADGSRLFFHDNRVQTKQLYVQDLGSGARQRLIEPEGQLENESWPRVSPDGEWVYFTGGAYDEAVIHRVRTDGTGRERVREGHDAAVSPDGARIAYILGGSLRITTLATGATVTVPGTALSPRWRPTGDEVVYLKPSESHFPQGELRAVNADGSGGRGLVPSGNRYEPHFDFSPDGKYIIASGPIGTLVVIEYASGAEAPMRLPALNHGLLAPAWKP